MTIPRRAITARKNEDLGDWYRIEWVDHDGKTWSEDAGWVSYHCVSARIEPYTCVEGTHAEITDLAVAVLAGTTDESKRCAVTTIDPDTVAFWSPRNSNDRMGYVHIEDARAWAREWLGGVR